MYLMGIAMLQEEVDVDELNNKDLDDYKKQAKRVSKQFQLLSCPTLDYNRDKR